MTFETFATPVRLLPLVLSLLILPGGAPAQAQAVQAPATESAPPPAEAAAACTPEAAPKKKKKGLGLGGLLQAANKAGVGNLLGGGGKRLGQVAGTALNAGAALAEQAAAAETSAPVPGQPGC